MEKEQLESLKTEVQDLLNQIVIKLKDVPKAVDAGEDDDYRSRSLVDLHNDVRYSDASDYFPKVTGLDSSEYMTEVTKEYLCNVREITKRITNENNTAHNEAQYYNSNCY